VTDDPRWIIDLDTDPDDVPEGPACVDTDEDPPDLGPEDG
jgi:hypothetical protein